VGDEIDDLPEPGLGRAQGGLGTVAGGALRLDGPTISLNVRASAAISSFPSAGARTE
jgi:hypothetical protein